VLQSEDNVLQVGSPVTICGDVHGDFPNVLEIFDVFGLPPEGKYLFLGDYVDRGSKSVETMLLLLCLKIQFPRDIFLIRGNHESTHHTITFGFYHEVMNKYGDLRIWQAFQEVFKTLPICAVVDSKIFCVHGGLCPNFSLISQLALINRFASLPPQGLMFDVLWSDPYPGLGFQTSPRQAGYLWGRDVSHFFANNNKLDLIVRGHEVQQGGYKVMHDDLVISIFSSPHYTSRFSEAAVLEVISPTERQITRFRPVQWISDMNEIVFPEFWCKTVECDD
jgi:diadenosine tetraphosphatase ApaH/serine/threonine PP2A family protein phosphatase